MKLSAPTAAPAYPGRSLSRWLRSRLYDPRDEVFARLTLRMALTMTALRAPRRFPCQTRALCAARRARQASMNGQLPVIAQ